MYVTLVIFLLVWALNEHARANDWRQQCRDARAELDDLTASASAPEPYGWRLTYVIGRATKTTVVPGATEQDALKAAVKGGLRFDRILTLERPNHGKTSK